MYTVSGRIKVINETQVINDRFSKREFVITDLNDQYPQTILFQLVQDKCDLLDSFELGQLVIVSFNLRGREWVSPDGVSKFFNTLEAWKIQAQTRPTATDEGLKNFESEQVVQEGEDDLPF